ncbi:unnamed protein product, partial [Iphiclides podalirius]
MRRPDVFIFHFRPHRPNPRARPPPHSGANTIERRKPLSCRGYAQELLEIFLVRSHELVNRYRADVERKPSVAPRASNVPVRLSQYLRRADAYVPNADETRKEMLQLFHTFDTCNPQHMGSIQQKIQYHSIHVPYDRFYE